MTTTKQLLRNLGIFLVVLLFAGMAWVAFTDHLRTASAQISAPEAGFGDHIPGDGTYEATDFGGGPGTIQWGTWTSTDKSTNCYWELNDGYGNIISNRIPGAQIHAVSVPVNVGQVFVTQGCGAWKRS